ncbi:MAG: hypothetical protein JWO63_1408 [Frankiales bacterium]|nr:hypothetical protein [Frankiales bacterium]
MRRWRTPAGGAGLRALADEQAALRRVATLVARGVPPEEVFAAVIEEAGRLLSVEFAGLGRYAPAGEITIVAAWGRTGQHIPVGRQWSLGGRDLATLVFETGRAARIDRYTDTSGQLTELAHEAGVGSGVAAPVIVEDHLWGVMATYSRFGRPLPPDVEARLASFTELVAVAIANADSRAELVASRARIVAAGDEARRRIERDLHDGIQQRLVGLGLELRMAQGLVPAGSGELAEALSAVGRGVAGVFEELREIAHGIHPAILSEGGLEPALRALGRRSAVAVELVVGVGRGLPAAVEVAAYFVVSEALANAAKHARASLVRVELAVGPGGLRLVVVDDGVGGAVLSAGGGLVGLGDRVAALGGGLTVSSPVGGGTRLVVEVPLPADLTSA